MICSKCNSNVDKFANAFHKLCKLCNLKRLEESKRDKVEDNTRIERKWQKSGSERILRRVGKVSKPKVKKKSRNKNFELDEKFYEECFNSCKEHKCEECNKQLNDRFRDASGNVIYKVRYSHIVPKSKSNELRHDVNNINHLCFDCHFKWEFGDKKSMKIYEENKAKFPQFLK